MDSLSVSLLICEVGSGRACRRFLLEQHLAHRRVPGKQEPDWTTLVGGDTFTQVHGVGPALGQSKQFTLEPFNSLLFWAIKARGPVASIGNSIPAHSPGWWRQDLNPDAPDSRILTPDPDDSLPHQA